MRRFARLTRSPLAYWLVVGRARPAHRDGGGAGWWATPAPSPPGTGRSRPVVVAVRALEPGTVVAAGDVAVRQVPASLVPDGAVGAIDEAEGRTVVAPVFPGVPSWRASSRPTAGGASPPSFPPGSRAVAVPNGRPSLALVRGDTVDVLATFDPADAGEGAPPTFPVAADALVVDVGDESAAVAVTPDEAARVAFALASGVVTLALASPGPDADRSAEARRQQPQHRQPHHHPVDDEGGERLGPHHPQHQPHRHRARHARRQHPPDEGGQRCPGGARRRRPPWPPGRCRPRR